jgi:hypothetical protein
MGTQVKKIKELAQYIPDKDKKLASFFIEHREFLNLLELVNSDIFLARKHQNSANPGIWENIEVDKLLELRTVLDEYTSLIYGSFEEEFEGY